MQAMDDPYLRAAPSHALVAAAGETGEMPPERAFGARIEPFALFISLYLLFG